MWGKQSRCFARTSLNLTCERRRSSGLEMYVRLYVTWSGNSDKFYKDK